jgi:hypothetical protein
MQKITNPATIKKNLVVASLFVTTYEILRASIVDKPKGFLNLAQGFTLDGTEPLTYSAEYRKEVVGLVIPEISQKKGEFHDFYASCLWFQNLEAITEDDVKDIQAIRKHRNMIAHEPVKLLIDDTTDISIDLLKKAQALLNKIDKWWILEIEIPASGEYTADHNITESDVESGMTLLLNYFMEIASDKIAPDMSSEN